MTFVLRAFVFRAEIPPSVMKDSVANGEKKMLLSDLSPTVAAAETPKEVVQKAEPADPMESSIEPTAEESAVEPVVVQGPNALEPADGE